MKKAVYIGIGAQEQDHEVRIFMVDPPHEGYDYVAVSARDIGSFTRELLKSMQIPVSYTGRKQLEKENEMETCIFGCDAAGVISDWTELEGSFKGEMNVARALRNVSYEIQEVPDRKK